MERGELLALAGAGKRLQHTTQHTHPFQLRKTHETNKCQDCRGHEQKTKKALPRSHNTGSVGSLPKRTWALWGHPNLTVAWLNLNRNVLHPSHLFLHPRHPVSQDKAGDAEVMHRVLETVPVPGISHTKHMRSQALKDLGPGKCQVHKRGSTSPGKPERHSS